VRQDQATDTLADFAATLWNTDNEAHAAALLDRLERHYYHARPVSLATPKHNTQTITF
jgi:hypothetical protein